MTTKRDLTTSERRQAGFGCTILVGAFIIASLGSMEGAMCETTIFEDVKSPNGLSKARVEMTDCGALSGFSRVVSVQPAWLPNGRLFACRAVVFDGEPQVKLEWANGRLVIKSDAPSSDVMSLKHSCKGWGLELRRSKS